MADEGDHEIDQYAETVLRVPPVPEAPHFRWADLTVTALAATPLSALQAAAALGGYLREAGLIAAPTTISIRQGEAMGRPSRLFVDADIENGRAVDIHVGGHCVLLGRGQIELP